jgi:hypothetical protein
MRVVIFGFVALTLCTRAWPQGSPKPEVDWAAIDKQLDALRSAVLARDIETSQKISQQLWSLTTGQWAKQQPTAADRLALAESRPANASTLPYLAFQAAQAGEFGKAEQYAYETLATPSRAYDSVHTGNIVLGLVALNRDNNVDSAKAYLLSAAKTKGSPHLDRWGPNLALAKELLDKGQREAVQEYFQLCKSFVTKNPKLDDWIAMLKGGGVPDLSHEYLWIQ